MRRASSILVLFVLLAFGVSLAVPAEDVAETSYDESESLPAESVPVLAIATPQTAAKASAVRPRYLGLPFAGESELHKSIRELRSVSLMPNSFSTLAVSLRC